MTLFLFGTRELRQGCAIHVQRLALLSLLALAGSAAPARSQVPPRLDIYHFDVNTGDATLILSPDGRGVLIDAGDRFRGHNPIAEFLNRARADGRLASLDYFIVTHYDADHIGGADELLNGEWYPSVQVYDRGDTVLPPFDRSYAETRCSQIDDVGAAEQIAPWGTAPNSFCRRRASCQIVEYFVAAERGGRRQTLRPGDTISLDHGVELTAIVVNATDIDGSTVDVSFSGRRDDCAANDLSVGFLLAYGDFRYLIAGDLTGDPTQDVADVEELLKDDAMDLDVYHVNHHGAETSVDRFHASRSAYRRDHLERLETRSPSKDCN
jgi:beta-lactamase superfamily II metal-dependent hydrolase